MSDDPRRPLAGVRVLDLTRLLPGNYATLVMAALGADVIKVEDTRAGDYIRAYGTQIAGAGAVHHQANRGKRSISLDLKNPADRADFEALVRTSQVLIESFRPGTLAKLGYSPAELHALRPDLVIASISGFGLDGPLADQPAHDLNFLAWSGFLDRLGTAGGDPVEPAIPLADLLAGMSCAMFTMPFIRSAERTGVGVVLDTPMIEALALLPSSLLAEHLAGTDVGGRGDFKLGGGSPLYAVYALADGHVAVVAQEERFWEALVKVVGLHDLADRRDDRSAHEEIRARLSTYFAGLTRQQVLTAFAGLDACVTPLQSYQEMLASPHARARGYVIESAVDAVPVLALPVTVDGARLSTSLPAPAQGQHTNELRDRRS